MNLLLEDFSHDSQLQRRAADFAGDITVCMLKHKCTVYSFEDYPTQPKGDQAQDRQRYVISVARGLRSTLYEAIVYKDCDYSRNLPWNSYASA